MSRGAPEHEFVVGVSVSPPAMLRKGERVMRRFAGPSPVTRACLALRGIGPKMRQDFGLNTIARLPKFGRAHHALTAPPGRASCCGSREHSQLSVTKGQRWKSWHISFAIGSKRFRLSLWLWHRSPSARSPIPENNALSSIIVVGMQPIVSVSDLSKTYASGFRGAQAHQSGHPPRRDFCAARPQRRRQDHADQHHLRDRHAVAGRRDRRRPRHHQGLPRRPLDDRTGAAGTAPPTRSRRCGRR